MNDEIDASVKSSRKGVPVVGIGASAGGIAALQALFAALPAKPGAAIAVVVHLDPSHTSELASIIQLRTDMPVSQVSGRVPLQADHVYVIPPDQTLFLSGDDIATGPFEERRGRRSPVDDFFKSLAADHRDSFAVVLSGTGSDGANGVRAVKDSGGVVLVQDPNEAEYPMMPSAALSMGADYVLPTAGLAKKLTELLSAQARARTDVDTSNANVIRNILQFLRKVTGQDFSNYKRTTVSRRIVRRMQLCGIESANDYFAYLSSNAEEAQALFNDFLISVTSFFRDPLAYKALAEQIVPRLMERDPGQPIRVWIPGCATGEEAYSIGMLLLEASAARASRPLIQIFASDLDTSALAQARSGRYPTSITKDVSAERLAAFFRKEGDHYVVKPELRDIVVFAVHGLLKDPPFSKIDLISCRNLLIYLEKTLQEQACRTFAYALVPSGYLFLGASETADSPEGLFKVVNREARLYQAQKQARVLLPPLPQLSATVASTAPAEPFGAALKLRQRNAMESHREALEAIAPPSMLVGRDGAILNLSETAGRFLLPPGGRWTNHAEAMVRPELRAEISAALHRAFRHNERTVTRPVAVGLNGSAYAVVLQVTPNTTAEGVQSALVLFIEGGSAASADESAGAEASPVTARLREELMASQLNLRTAQEQYEELVEELRAANEELQSINEEYLSTHEELETSKEEMQSINEELQTLNSELKIKLDMVSRSNSDLKNLMGATDIATMFLDADMRIQRFTPRATELFSIHPGDEGRSITDFTHRLEYQDLVADATRVLSDLTPIERTIHTVDDRWLTTRLRPYRTIDDKIEGVVVTFFDVTERKKADAQWAARQELLLREFAHRMKNTLAVVQSIVSQSLRGSKGLEADPGLAERICERLGSLAKTHDLFVRNDWSMADMRELARNQLEPYLEEPGRVTIEGEAVRLNALIASPLGLVLHELATNAVKYGALGGGGGRVLLTWHTDTMGAETILTVVWRERGGPNVAKPADTSLGTKLIERAIPGARADSDYAPEGVTWTLRIPLPAA